MFPLCFQVCRFWMLKNSLFSLTSFVGTWSTPRKCRLQQDQCAASQAWPTAISQPVCCKWWNGSAVGVLQLYYILFHTSKAQIVPRSDVQGTRSRSAQLDGRWHRSLDIQQYGNLVKVSEWRVLSRLVREVGRGQMLGMVIQSMCHSVSSGFLSRQDRLRPSLWRSCHWRWSRL